jgi:phospholipid/cholesterol/gamma-HCH transport system substrate-binding protein
MKIRTEIKAGIIAVLAIAAFIWLFSFFKGLNIIKSIDTYHAIYARINGLKESNPVLINGYRVGAVKKIQLMPAMPGHLLVTMALEESVDLPSNTMAEIYSADLMGTQAIRLILGNDTAMAQTGDTLMGAVEGSLSEQVSAQMLPVKNKAERLMASIDSVMAVLTVTFNEDFRDNFNESFENITGTLAHLKSSSYTLDTLITKEDGVFATTVYNVQAISGSLREHMNDLEAILENVNTISDSLASANLKSLVNNMEQTLYQTDLLMSNINEGKGTIGKLATNDSLYRNLERLTRDLDLLLLDLQENPKRYVHFSLFGGGKSKKNDPEEDGKQPE